MSRNERLYTLPIAVEKATGRRPHLTTCLRWTTRGVSGIKLESFVLGGRRLTSEEAVLRFMDAVTEVKTVSAGSALSERLTSPRAAQRAAEQLRRELA